MNGFRQTASAMPFAMLRAIVPAVSCGKELPVLQASLSPSGLLWQKPGRFLFFRCPSVARASWGSQHVLSVFLRSVSLSSEYIFSKIIHLPEHCCIKLHRLLTGYPQRRDKKPAGLMEALRA